MEGFKNLLDNVHCILRDKLGIKGMVAMRCIISLFQLKLIEPKLIEYNKKCSNEEKKINEMCYFKNIIDFTDNNNEGNLINHMIPFTQEQLDTTVFGILLSHEETKMFFKRDIIDKFRKLKSKQSILKNLLNKINKQFPESLTVTNYDQFGEAYEDFLSKQISSGQSLGQFFTPRIVINYISELLNPDIGKTIYDPTSGTGGFIMALYKFMSDKTKKIKQLKNNTFFGGDIDDEVIDLLRFNLYMHGINLDENIFRHGNSFLHGYENKFDYIAANPPFGMKKIDFAELSQELPGYYSIESGKGELLFLQHMYKALKVGGECAVIVPEGVLNNTNKDYKCVRELLLNNCVMKSIISLPSGVFNNTGVKTSIFHFVKGGKTKTVQYKEFKVIDENNNRWEIIDILKVGIDKIKNNNYLLNPDKYVEVKEIKYKEGIVLRTLGDICDIDTKVKKHSTDHGNATGKYKFHTGGVRTDLYVDEYDIEELYIIQNRTNGSGKCNLFMDKKFSIAKQTMVYIAKNKNEITTKYIYYYLNSNISILEKGFIGANHKNISHGYLENIKIPVPPIEQQNQIVENLDFLHEECIKTSMKKIQELKKVNEIMMLTQSRYGDNVMRTLGNIICTETGTFNTKNMSNEGEYAFYNASVNTPIGYHNEYSFDGEKYIIFIKSGGNSKNKVSTSHALALPILCSGKIACVMDIIKITTTDIKIEYLYNCLLMLRGDIQKNAKYTTNLGHVDMNYFKALKIPIPSLEQQTQIVEHLDNNNKLIEQLEKEIARCKLLSNKIMSSLVSKDEQLDNNKPDITQETKTSKKIYKLDKDDLCQSTEIDEHNISNSDLDMPHIKKKKIVNKEYNSDSDDTNHIVSDEPNIKKKNIVKKEYNSDNDEQETKQIVKKKNDNQNTKTKKYYTLDDTTDNDNQHTKTKKYCVSDDNISDSIKPRIKKIIKKEYNSGNEQYTDTIEDANIETQYKKKIENRKTKSVKRNT